MRKLPLVEVIDRYIDQLNLALGILVVKNQKNGFMVVRGLAMGTWRGLEQWDERVMIIIQIITGGSLISVWRGFEWFDVAL